MTDPDDMAALLLGRFAPAVQQAAVSPPRPARSYVRPLERCPKCGGLVPALHCTTYHLPQAEYRWLCDWCYLESSL